MAVNGANDKPKTLEEYQELAKTAAQDNDAATVKQKISIFSDGAWKLEQQIAPNGIDKNEMPILQQWINMLSTYTNNLSASIKKACKDAIDRLDEVIENLKEMALGANQTDAAQIKDTDIDNKKAQFSFMCDVARSYGWEPDVDKYGTPQPLETWHIRGMQYSLLEDRTITPKERVEIFSAWIDMHRREIKERKLESFVSGSMGMLAKSAEINDFYNDTISDCINNHKYGSSFIARHGKEYKEAMKKYGHSHDLKSDLEVVKPKDEQQV